VTQLDSQLAAVAHPTRLAILRLALRREYSAGALADAFAVSRPAVSQHIRLLVDAGLLRERRDGQRRLYKVDAAAAEALRREFDGFWASGLARLKEEAEGSAAVKRKRRRHG
jgi:DNA-binding transcriptional ArsR family regulator